MWDTAVPTMNYVTNNWTITALINRASVENTGQRDYMYQWSVCVCVCVCVCAGGGVCVCVCTHLRTYVLYIVDYPHLHTASLITPVTTVAGKQADFSTQFLL